LENGPSAGGGSQSLANLYFKIGSARSSDVTEGDQKKRFRMGLQEAVLIVSVAGLMNVPNANV
jgi:hypothetical protein